MIFKEKTGQNFKDYLLSTRMNRAKRLLRQGEPIYEIARQLGYEDAEHFSRRFRARFGLSPAAYRREGEDTNSVATIFTPRRKYSFSRLGTMQLAGRLHGESPCGGFFVPFIILTEGHMRDRIF